MKNLWKKWYRKAKKNIIHIFAGKKFAQSGIRTRHPGKMSNLHSQNDMRKNAEKWYKKWYVKLDKICGIMRNYAEKCGKMRKNAEKCDYAEKCGHHKFPPCLTTRLPVIFALSCMFSLSFHVVDGSFGGTGVHWIYVAISLIDWLIDWFVVVATIIIILLMN